MFGTRFCCVMSPIMLQISLILLCVALSSPGRLYQPEVDTPLGKIIGETIFFQNTPVYAFHGIPFAKPPVNEYRFKKPSPVEKWTAPLFSNNSRPACVQYSSNPFPWLDNSSNQDQDCLYLNVWVPTTSTASHKKAVMFWLYGGGFRIGSNGLDFYDGRALAAIGDVIVVAPNYRLGPEGFLYFGTEDAPGNMGLHDMLEALKWVHSNIESFGGNKKNVTLFGQSAGAIAIGMLMVSPLARGLFVRAILQSGSPANLDAENNDRDFNLSQAVAKAVGCMSEDKSLDADAAAEVVACLRGKDALNLTKTVNKVSDNPQRGLYPRFGDDILPWNARESLIRGNFANVDILIGNVANEGASMITKAFKDVFGFFGEKNPHINKTSAEYIIRKNFKSFNDTDAVVKQYLRSKDDDGKEDFKPEVQSASGDYARFCPCVYLAERVAKNRNQVFYYLFTHRPSVTPWAPWMGVVHFDETPFVFGYPLRYPDHFTREELYLSKLMVDIWTNFAKTGRTNQNWPSYSRSNPVYFNFSTHLIHQRAEKQDPERCNFFRPYFGF